MTDVERVKTTPGCQIEIFLTVKSSDEKFTIQNIYYLSMSIVLFRSCFRISMARVKKEDTLFEDTSEDTFEDTFGDTFNDLPSFNYPLRTLLITSDYC